MSVVDVSNEIIIIRDTSNNPSNIDVEIIGCQLFSVGADPHYTADASRGFFINDTGVAGGAPSHTNKIRDLSLNLAASMGAFATPSIGGNISDTTINDPSFAPGVPFGINAYIRSLPTAWAPDGSYTYMATAGNPPPSSEAPTYTGVLKGAMLFQLPDVSTNFATITGPNQITFKGITKAKGINKYYKEGNIVGNSTRGVMDSSGRGFSWKINNTSAEYPMVSDGDGSVWDEVPGSGEWEADDTTFNNILDNASRGNRYWINAWLQDGSGVFYYPAGAGADNFHPTPDNAVEITIPDIETNTSTSVTRTTALIRGRIETGSYYESEPAITQYGFYFDISSNVTPTTEVGVVNNNIPGSNQWTTLMNNLTPSTGYRYRTWGHVDSVGISGEVVHFRTLPDEPIIDNSFITIIDSSTVSFTGHMDASGQGDTSANIMGFFYNTTNTPQATQLGVSNVISDDSSGVNVSFSADSSSLLPGVDYYVNAYTTVVDGFPNFNETIYYYKDVSGTTTAQGMSFKIPDVSSIFHTGGSAADSTVIVTGHDTITATVTMKAIVLAGGAPMDSSGFGFTWQKDLGAQNYVFPRWDENNYIEDFTVPWPVSPGTITWSDTVDFDRGSRYWFNAYIHDGSGIYYYPLKTVGTIEDASAFQFTIPTLTTPPPTSITEHEATLKASVVVTGTYNSGPPILRHGFYLDANNSNPSTEYGVSTIDPAAGTWNYGATSLPANTLHYVQPFFHIGSSFYGISGEIVSFITLPDFPEVTNKDPTFAWDGITLRATCDDLGTGPNAATKTGFFISPATGPGAVTNPGYGTGGVEFIADQTPTVNPFHKDISFNDLPDGYIPGGKYYYNAYVFDPSATTSNPSGRFRYENGFTPPNPGRYITLGKVDTLTSAIKAQYATDNYKAQFNWQVITLPETSTGAGGVAITDISMGLFISTTIEDPSSGTLDVGRLWSGATMTGFYDDISDNFFHDVSYNFNAFVTDDWPNYYFEDGSANEGSWAPAWATDTTSRQLRIPDVSSNVPYDISGDNVDISGQRSATTQTITEYGFYLSLDGSGGPGATTKVSSQTADPDNTFHFTYNKLRPIDISFASLGGDVSYNVNAYLIVDNIELSGNTTDISFNTPAWPKPKNIDISRNVGQGPSGEEGYAILRGQVLDLGFGTENVGGANDVNLGFYIHDNIEARDGLAAKGKVSYDASTAQVGDIFELDSSTNAVASSDYLSGGVIYYVNAFIEKATAWWTKPQYYEGPNYLGDIDSTTEARLDAETTAGIPNSFPDGMGFSIPKLQNQNPVILDSCAVQFKLNIDSSGHLIGNANPGTEELGFFWSDDPSKCYNQATNVHNEPIYTWTGDNGIQTLDVSALPQGITCYYTAYTEYTAQDRGEGIDGDDIWYPPGYIKQDTTLVYKDFCIGDPSFTQLPAVGNGTITDTTTTLHLDLSGDYPIPQPNLNGITYWHHGENVTDSSNEIFGVNPMPDVGVGGNFALTSLTSGLKYSAIPFIRQDSAGISGEEISWYTSLKECVVQNDPITNITKDSATLNATLSDNPPWNKDPGLCMDHGFVYTKTDDDNYLPTIGVDTLKQMPGPGKTDTGSFGDSPDGNIAGLDLNRQYNVRTYANNTSASEPTGGGLVYNPASAPSSIFYTLLPPPTMNSTVTSTIIDVNTVKLDGGITNDPDPTSFGPIEKYGFVWRQYDPSSIPQDLHDIIIPTADDCDGSNNLFVGAFSEGDFETTLTAGAPRASFDLSSNRMYYVRSYAQNKSVHPGRADISGVGYNIVDASFTTKLQLPILITGDIIYPPEDINLNYGAMGWSITNFTQGDPTIWGGLTEFGFIWDTKAGIDASNVDIITLEHAAACVGPTRAGMYRRGDHNYLPQDFSGVFLNATPGGIHPDASFDHLSFVTPDEYLGSSGLGLTNSFSGLPAPNGIGPADASNTPFLRNVTYVARAYAYVKSIIYGNETSPGIYPEYLIYSPQIGINFNAIPAEIEADYQGDPFQWSLPEYYPPPSLYGGLWSRPKNITFDSADLSGNLLSNPLDGIFAYGYLWWDGGETVLDRTLLTWPGKTEGQISPQVALNNGFFSMDSGDGSNNFFSSEPPYTISSGGIFPQGFPTLSENITTKFYNTKPIATDGGTDPSGLMVNRTIWMRPYVWNRDPAEPEETNLWKISYGELGRLELDNYPSFGIDMTDPLINQESIDNNIKPNTARIFGKIIANEQDKITDYGFCWREVEQSGSQYNYVTEEMDENVIYPAPTIYDNSMVSLFVFDTSFNDFQEPGCDPSSHEVGGLFPGLSDPSFVNVGMSQAPPSFTINERSQGWSFFYNVGDNGKELKEDCGAFDPSKVGFDASSGILKPLTYYFIRSYARGPEDETAATNIDDGERKSGIKYGPIWYGGTEETGHLKKGYVLLTAPFGPCELGEIQVLDYNYKNVDISGSIITNPLVSSLLGAGVIIAEGQQQPTLNSSGLLRSSTVEDVFTDPPLPIHWIIEDCANPILLPNTQYSIGLWADNTDTTGDVDQGGISYSPNYESFITDYTPTPQVSIHPVTDISWNRATFEGEIISNIGEYISEMGFCYGISGENASPPRLGDSSFVTVPMDELVTFPAWIPGTGLYSKPVTNLITGVSYEIVAFVKSVYSDPSVVYSSTFEFLSLPFPPPPLMGAITQIPQDTRPDPWKEALFYGSISDTSGSDLIDHHGFIWTTQVVSLNGLQQDPADLFPAPGANDLQLSNYENILDLGLISEWPTNGLVRDASYNFKSEIKGLSPGIVYYIRSFASINPTGYGEVYVFQTPFEPCKCKEIPKPLGAQSMPACGMSKAMKMSQTIKIKSGPPLPTNSQGITANLPGGRGKESC
jgi:hypothetical protein